MTRIALVSAAAAVHLDEDLPPLVEALRAAGARPEVVVWDDPAVGWAEFDLAVVRSTWDYVARRDEFLAWAERAAASTPLVNPPGVLRWSTDKRYLADLAAADVPVTPTAVVEPGDDVATIDGEVVVKPAVGAGSMDAERFVEGRERDAEAHARRLLGEGRTVLVQPYLANVDADGETGLVFFGGRFSHAIRKGPILRVDGTVFVEGLYAEEELSPRQAAADELIVAEQALAAVPGGHGPLAYARIDVVRDASARPVVLEVELAEPSVFLNYDAGAAARFAAALLEAAPR